MRFRIPALFLLVFACSAALIAEEEAEEPREEALDKDEAAVKPAPSPELRNRAAFLRRAAAYWRDNGDEDKARFFEERAAALESSEPGGLPELRERRSAPDERPDRAGDTGERGRARRGERAERSPRAGTSGPARRRTGSPITNVAGERVAGLQKELEEARAAGEEARAKELSKQIALLRAMILQEAVVREQAKRITDLERDMRALKGLLLRLAAGSEEE